ncbi:hypothetical protein P9847_08605 [Paenibacillus chibensis]|uniref:Uncharacterized protein n=1 Tax=Paenibacillus chibensis TaxID=59846 RepID=A0ABU6PR56_9BACL|nr:hypothetical protein [Paenibacillus chibensis]
MLGIIIMLVVYLLLGVIVIKLGIENSKSHKVIEEILEEIREMKEIIRDKE